MLNFIFPLNFLLFILLLISCESIPRVKTGLDNISSFNYLFQGKRLGIITNHTAYNSEDEYIIDIFFNMPDVEIKALFAPEHGISGKEANGKIIEDGIHSVVNVPIYSLYGKIRKPTIAMLKEIDVLVFDIQDIGTRFYTYTSTMSLAMEAAAETRIPFVVLDRPNPINGIDVEGNILEPEYATFVGLHPIPVRHGMTVGELATMINEERWLKNGIHVDLEIVPMANWQRWMWADQTGIRWRPPSPNMPDLDVATVYPGTCLFEGTNISEGRGTYQPFLRIGAPWLEENQFSSINEVLNLTGVHVDHITFIPRSIPDMAPHPKFLDTTLVGIKLLITDRNKVQPYLLGISLVKYFYEANKKEFNWHKKHFDRLCGTSKIREFILKGKELAEIKKWIDRQLKPFMEIRNKYLLY